MPYGLRDVRATAAHGRPRIAIAALILAVATLAATYQAATTAAAPGTARLSLAKQVGQVIIAGYRGQTPPARLLRAIRLGQVGAVILMGDNTRAGIRATKAATARMQAAARSGGNAGLLIMTDQEGGQVKRFNGPPAFPAIAMANPATAYSQGRATGALLRSAGVNVDLAPVADVIRVKGFIQQEGRSFGSSPAVVANAACRFAAGLAEAGVAYTLKHFPGLGDAVATTDVKPVSVTESAAQLYQDDAAYRRCGHGPLALVMISSASYPRLTGKLPAVLTAKTYAQVLPLNRVTALPITDSFESGAINAFAARGPAKTAINAGVDMVMYAADQSVALSASTILVADARTGALSRARVRAASARVLALKQQLGLVTGAG
ncbi:MAG: glycoside hydrolase family 3 protein [Acidobacteriota bacterium]|nr:glycoside hydrolase family 3 protein [Acidobacteriota bacterium]